MARTVIVDGQEYEIPDDGILGEEPSQDSGGIGDTLYKSSLALGQGLEQATRDLEVSGLGLFDYTSDALGYDTSYWEDLIAKRKKEAEQAKFDEIKGTGYDTASNVIQNIAPVLGAGVATGGAGIPALVGGLKGFSDQYQQSEDNNQSFGDATAQALVRGGGEAISNAVEAVPLFKAGSALSRIAKSAIYGSAGNVLSEGSNLIADNQFTNDPNWSDNLGKAAGEGVLFGTALGSAGEALGVAGAKTLGRNREALDELKIKQFEDALSNEQLNVDSSQQFNPESLPPATPSDNLSSENFPTIELATPNEFPKGFNPETGYYEQPKSTLIDESGIPIIQKSPLAEGDVSSLISPQRDFSSPNLKDGIVRPDSFNPRTPEEVLQASRELDVLQNTDSYKPNANVINPIEGAPTTPLSNQQLQSDPLFQQVIDGQRGQPLNSEAELKNQLEEQKFNQMREAQLERASQMFDPNRPQTPTGSKDSFDIFNQIENDIEPPFVQAKRAELYLGDNQTPLSQLPETPLSNSEVSRIAPSLEPKKYQDTSFTKNTDFSSPIKDAGNNNPKIIQSVSQIEPTTNAEIILPYDAQVKTRSDAIIRDADEASKILKEIRKANQRGSFSLRKVDQTPWAERTKSAREYDPDGIISPAAKVVNQWLRMPRTFAEKYQAFMPAYRAISEGIPAHFGTKLVKFRETGSPYFDLKSNEREIVNSFLQADRRGVAKAKESGRLSQPASPEAMGRAGLNPNQIQAVLSVRKMMDDALDTMSDSWKTKTLNRTDISSTDKEDISKAIDAYVSDHKGQGYVPSMRFGRFYLEVRNKQGELVNYAFRNSKQEIRKLEAEFKKSNPELKTQPGTREVIPDEVYNDLPADIGGYLFFLDQQKPSNAPKGVMGNFMKARHIDGADPDLTRSIATYVQGVSKYSARAQFDSIINNSINTLKDSEPHAAAEAMKYVNDLRKPSSKAGQIWNEYLVPFYNFQYLSGNVSNITLNALEPFMSTYPQIGYHLRGTPGDKAFASERIAIKSAVDMMVAPMASTKFRPDLADAVKYAKENSFLDDTVIREIHDMSRGRASAPFSAMKKAGEVLSLGNNKVEELVKYYDYITGYNVARQRGLSGTDAYDYAMHFTNDVKSSGRKSEQNALFRNAPAISLFRNYSANQLRQLGRTIGNKDGATLARQLLIPFGIAGVQGLPFAKELLSGYDLWSEDGDWKSSARKGLGKLGLSNNIADSIIYGSPAAATGWVYSNTAGYGNIFPSADGSGIFGQIGKTVLGASSAPFTQVDKALELYKSGRGDLALERISPVLGREILRGNRTLKEGITDARGYPVKAAKDLTLSDKIAPFTNTTTLDTAKRYEARNAARKIDDRASGESKNFNDQLFWAYVQKDRKKKTALINEAKRQGKNLSDIERAISNRLKEYNDPEKAIKNRLPENKRKEFSVILDRIKN
jgi:hypothetical protein